MELDIRKIDKLELQFLQKSSKILNKKTVTREDLKRIHLEFEKTMKSIGREPLRIYRNVEFILRGTNYNIESTIEENVYYLRRILTEEENDTLATVLIGTIATIATADRVSRESEV